MRMFQLYYKDLYVSRKHLEEKNKNTTEKYWGRGKPKVLAS